MLSCHYCGYSVPVPENCPQCETKSLTSKGFGTERIEDTLSQLFPQATVKRMDLDTTRSRTHYEELLTDVKERRADILVGTQMVAKGLDFAGVRLVGILDASSMLRQPDFRAYERGFQLMAQVAGRAGRHELRGKVILQTMEVSSSVVAQVVNHDYEGMFREQIEERRQFSYPPFCRLTDIYVKHKDLAVAEHMAEEMAAVLRHVFGTRVLGPVAPPVARQQSLHIRKITLKTETSASPSAVSARLTEIVNYIKSKDVFRSASVVLDVDPL
jgi:primosomal protein N' (replication factor Y)